MKRCRHQRKMILWAEYTGYPKLRTLIRGRWYDYKDAHEWCPDCGAVCVLWTPDRRRWLRPAQSAAEGKGKNNGDC